MYDVVIIGAGPAGTAAAYDLLGAGFSVLILDKYEFPRKKACAGGITPKAMALFRYDISPLVHQTCHEVQIRKPGGDTFLVQDKHPLCYMTQRQDLDIFSLNKVIAKGGQFRVTPKIISIKPGSAHVEICFRNEIVPNHTMEDQTVRARYLIGADGANSIVRRQTGLPKGITRYPALEADVAVDLSLNQSLKYPMEFDFSMGIQGYYWVFPKQGFVNIGIYSASSDQGLRLKALTDYARKRFGQDRLENIKGYPIGVGGFFRGPGSGRVLLVGDAAGLAEGLLGEGIYFALKSGQSAAASIIRSLLTGQNAGILYGRSVRRIRLDLGLYHLGSKVLYQFPGPCLALASHPFIHSPFSRGYAAGKTLGQILSFH